MSTAQLRSFNAVAVHGSFQKAALALGRTQPTLTMQVAALEAAYNAELLIRSRGRSVQLTPLGRELQAITRTMFALEGDALSLLRDAGTLGRSRLNMHSTSPILALRILQKIKTELPDLNIQLGFGNSATIMQRVVDCEIDIGIMGGGVETPECLMVPIARPEIVLAVHSSHPSAQRGIITREDYAKETLLIREGGSETRELFLRRAHELDYRCAHMMEIGSRGGAIAGALAGMGVAPISEYEIEDRPELAILRLDGSRIFGINHAVCLRRRAGSRLIRECLRLTSSLE